ncbi:DUF7620 family protein [Streptomyces longwoodensis]|uniref:DUF7620 family protein n=1 Tax=Streptomyces longwoodensis TaxID=68231 RepID=UPI003F4D0176
MLAWIRRLAQGHDQTELSDSEAALERATADREEAEARGPVVHEAVAPVRRARLENHLAERIEAAFRGAAR